MKRLPLLIPILVIAVALVATPVAASPVADSGSQATASIELFGPAASNGLHAHVEAFNGEVTLEFVRKGLSASYKVPGEITEAGVKARFGKLGLIDVAFSPTKTLRTDEPPQRCAGEPSVFSEGLFTGTIEFTGEREYVRIKTVQVEGRMYVNREPEWRCPHGKGRTPLRSASRPLATGTHGQSDEAEPALLFGHSRGCRCFFLALSEPEYRGHRRSAFLGATLERKGAMEITRETRAAAGASAFAFDHTAGTATVRPPSPLSGHATFQRRPHGRDLWRSTIRVPLLGADPLNVRGLNFPIRLTRSLPGD